MTNSSLELRRRLESRARELGISLFGVAGTDRSSHIPFYEEWLRSGFHGEMRYLAREDSVARRASLRGTMESVRSVVVVGHEYCTGDPGEGPSDPSRAIIARYARGEDYHELLKGKLEQLLQWLSDEVDGGVRGLPYVDTGPILERDLAQRAGLGWHGRNTLLVNPKRGSYFFLGVLLLDIDLPPNEPFGADRCGSCRACLDSCPTGALLGKNQVGAPAIDARRCISYLTIELRGPIPLELRRSIGNRVFGCDICQEVCPFSRKFSVPATEPAYLPRLGVDEPTLVELAEELLSMSERGFRRAYTASPMVRPGRKGLLRNVCVALGNWGSHEAVPTLVRALEDRQPLVRGHAAWALGRVSSAAAIEALSLRADEETDSQVRDELNLALGR